MGDEDKRWTEHCAPAFDLLHKDHQKLVDRVTAMEIVTKNGLLHRMKHVEKMQWWLLGALGALGGLMITLHVAI